MSYDRCAKKVSVIIPVYNAEKYLRACLDSVLNQIGFSVEVICVDDGSTDDSPAILGEYAAKDPRVTVLTQTNQGPGVARNAGLAVAKGEYVMFLDADDRLTSGRNLKAAFDYAKSNRLDVLVLSSNKLLNEGGGLLDGGSLRREMIPSEKVFTPEAVGINLFVFTVQVPWAKLYRREFITTHGLNFPALTRSEDFPFVMSSLLKAKAIGILDIPLCDHRIGVETSLESTKDETPCIFLEAANWFCKSVDLARQPEWVKQAFRVSMVCRYAYNLKAIRCFSGFKQIVARLMQETGESLRLIEGYQNPAYVNVWDLLDRVQKAQHDDYALVDLFVEIQTKRRVNTAVVRANAERDAARGALNKVRAARDAALRERNTAREVLEKVRAVRDAALRERNTAREVLEKVRAVRDAALRERAWLRKNLAATRLVRDQALKLKDQNAKRAEMIKRDRDRLARIVQQLKPGDA